MESVSKKTRSHRTQTAESWLHTVPRERKTAGREAESEEKQERDREQQGRCFVTTTGQGGQLQQRDACPRPDPYRPSPSWSGRFDDTDLALEGQPAEASCEHEGKGSRMCQPDGSQSREQPIRPSSPAPTLANNSQPQDNGSPTLSSESIAPSLVCFMFRVSASLHLSPRATPLRGVTEGRGEGATSFIPTSTSRPNTRRTNPTEEAMHFTLPVDRTTTRPPNKFQTTEVISRAWRQAPAGGKQGQGVT